MIFHYGKFFLKINKFWSSLEGSGTYLIFFINEKKRFNEGEAIANMVVEIPRWSHAKLELNPKEQLNPIYHVSN